MRSSVRSRAVFVRLSLAAVATFASNAVLADPTDIAGRLNPVVGEKLDSGLGSLSARSDRAAELASGAPSVTVAGRRNPVVGEKLDSGLGEISSRAQFDVRDLSTVSINATARR